MMLINNYSFLKIYKINGGDFNCALTQCEKKGGTPTTGERQVINEIKKPGKLYDLCDTWRFVNPDPRQFSLRDKYFITGAISARLLSNLQFNELNSLNLYCPFFFYTQYRSFHCVI